MKKIICTLVTKLTFGKVCFGWCVEPIKPKKEVKKMSTGKSVKKKSSKKKTTKKTTKKGSVL